MRCGGRGAQSNPKSVTWRGDLDKKKPQRQSQDMNIWQYLAQDTVEGQKYCTRNTAQKILEIMGLREL